MHIAHRLVMVVILLTIPVAARAELISVNDVRYGNDSLTLDTGTGLEWLDLTRSANRSFNDLMGLEIGNESNEFEAGGDFEGFRFATADEVRTFFGHAGVTIDTSDQRFTGYEEVALLMGLVGVTDTFSEPWDDGIRLYSVGYSSTVSTPGGRQSPVLVLHAPGVNNPYSYGYGSINNNVADAAPSRGHGSWLVRDPISLVEPSSLALLGAGLGTLSLFRRRLTRPPSRQAGKTGS